MKISTKSHTLPFCYATIVGFVACLLNTQSAFAQSQNDIQWLTNVEQAKQIAEQQNKLVLLHFGASWCRPCRALDTYVFRAGSVKKAIAENVVPVKLDADRELSLVNEYDVSMVPFDVIITPKGRVITERRSPADADNYAKMISGTSTASRMLSKEKLGPIAHQRKVISNRKIAGQDPLDFRAKGPEVGEVGLSKDASLLQRRQTAFSENKSIKKTNPFASSASSSQVEMPESTNGIKPKTSLVTVDDLERNQFLSKEREWPTVPKETRRAKPERIINDRYFESLKKKSNNDSQPVSLASTSREVEPFSVMNDADGKTSANELTLPSFSVESGGDFQVQTASRNESINPAIIVSEESVDSGAVVAQEAIDLSMTFCLKGKCPVTLITEGRWENGDKRFGIVHRNRTYIFADAEKLAIFKTDPDKFSPVLAGFDPVVFQEQGKLVDGLVENGVFMGRMPAQKVVLFQNAETRAKFQASPKKYIEAIRAATRNAASAPELR